MLSCNTATDHKDADGGADSVSIVHLLRDAYKWHNERINKPDVPDLAYMIIVNDTLQTGLDTGKLVAAKKALQQTGFFTAGFLSNFEKIGRDVDSSLRHGKYYNEINFDFQDADQWNYFQDDAGNYWDSLQIHDFKAAGDSASLQWSVTGVTGGYLVKFRKENSKWKIAYMDGFKPSSGLPAN